MACSPKYFLKITTILSAQVFTTSFSSDISKGNGRNIFQISSCSGVDIGLFRQPEFGEVRIGEQNMEFDYSEWKTIGYSYDSTLHWSELETKDGLR